MKKIFVAILLVLASISAHSQSKHSQDFRCFVKSVRSGKIDLTLPESKLIKFNIGEFNYFISYESNDFNGDSIGLFLYKAQGANVMDSVLVDYCSTIPTYYQYTSDYWVYKDDLMPKAKQMAWIKVLPNNRIEMILSFGAGSNYSKQVIFFLTPDKSNFGYEIHRYN